MKPKPRPPTDEGATQLVAENARLREQLASLEENWADTLHRMKETLQDLQVHQEELRAQNEQLRTAQIELERIGTKYRDLFEKSPTGYFIVDGRHCIDDVNAAGLKMLGRPRTRVVGKPFVLFAEQGSRRALDLHFNLVQSGERASTELRLQPENLDPYPVILESMPLSDAWGQGWRCLTVAFDITERKFAEEALRDSETRFRTIFQQNPLGMQILGADRRIRLSNPAWHRMWNHPARDEEPALPLHPEESLNAAFGGRAQELAPMRVASAPGRIRWVRGYVYPITGGEAVDEVVLMHEDVTERIEAEGKLERAVHALACSNDELQQFAYVASHDLQEPLRMVVSFLGLLERRMGKTLDEENRSYIHFATDGAHRMQKLILDLLALSRADRQVLEIEETSCAEAFEVAVTDLAPAIEAAGGVVRCGHLPKVMADRAQLQRLLENLIGNAIKYHGPDRRPEVVVEVDDLPTEWRFRIVDNGIGIDPAHFETVFKIFQRLHARDEYSGTGIGLAICKRIVERHGGRIWVESTPGEGSTFLFTLPKPSA